MAIMVYKMIPDATIQEWVDDFIPRLEEWFAANPKRIICKCDWLYGKSIDLRRDNYKTKLQAEAAKSKAKFK